MRTIKYRRVGFYHVHPVYDDYASDEFGHIVNIYEEKRIKYFNKERPIIGQLTKMDAFD